MKTIRTWDGARARLEEAAQRILLASAPDPPSIYEAHEQAAILILDSETYDYPPGALQQFLERYLEDLRNKLDLPQH